MAIMAGTATLNGAGAVADNQARGYVSLAGAAYVLGGGYYGPDSKNAIPGVMLPGLMVPGFAAFTGVEQLGGVVVTQNGTATLNGAGTVGSIVTQNGTATLNGAGTVVSIRAISGGKAALFASTSMAAKARRGLWVGVLWETGSAGIARLNGRGTVLSAPDLQMSVAVALMWGVLTTVTTDPLGIEWNVGKAVPTGPVQLANESWISTYGKQTKMAESPRISMQGDK